MDVFYLLHTVCSIQTQVQNIFFLITLSNSNFINMVVSVKRRKNPQCAQSHLEQEIQALLWDFPSFPGNKLEIHMNFKYLSDYLTLWRCASSWLIPRTTHKDKQWLLKICTLNNPKHILKQYSINISFSSIGIT